MDFAKGKNKNQIANSIVHGNKGESKRKKERKKERNIYSFTIERERKKQMCLYRKINDGKKKREI